MMDHFKKVQLRQKGPIAYRVLKAYMEASGFVEKRISGSHHIWESPNGIVFSIPVHGSEVKSCYVKNVRNWVEQNL